MKQSARLDINHVHPSFAPFNLYPDWLPYVLFAQQPCQAPFFYTLYVKYGNIKQSEVFD